MATDSVRRRRSRWIAGAEGYQQAVEATDRPVPDMLDAMVHWWTIMSVADRQEAICEDRFPNFVLDALQPVVDTGWLLPVIQRYLTRVTDSTKLSESTFVNGLTRTYKLARQLAFASSTMGEPRRYDPVIASLSISDGHEEGYHQRYVRSLALLGEVYLKEGDLVVADRLLGQARALDPIVAPMFATRLALRKGDTAQAVRELALYRLTLAGTWPRARDSATQQQLRLLYRRINHGSLEGLDTIIRQAVERPTLPVPSGIRSWQPSSGGDTTQAGVPIQSWTPTPRVSLVQYATWRGCPPCAMHDWAVRGLDQRFDKHIVVLAYHYSPPMTAPQWFGTGFGIDSMAARVHNRSGQDVASDTTKCIGLWVDGSCVRSTIVVGGRKGALPICDEATAVIEHDLAAPSGVRLEVRAQRDSSDRVVVRASAIGLNFFSNPKLHPLKLQLVLVEDDVPLSGLNNAGQRHVVRAFMGDSANGFGIPVRLSSDVVTDTFDLEAIEAITRDKAVKNLEQWEPDKKDWPDFDTNPEYWYAFHIDRRRLAVVAYLQDQTDGEVLQATKVPVPTRQ